MPKDASARLDLILQVLILLTAMPGAWMIALPATSPAHRWGYVVLALGQPLWIWATARHRQWGMLSMSLFYTGVWTTGALARF